ncbi:MAG: hypothetical protein LC769_13590, partial [Chloroflexi bacterium]|nr:hypothetical protein [Chloroflexota bacterium]
LIEAAREAPDAPRVASLAYGYLTVLLVPLRTPDAVVGHLCLGPKASGEPFRAEDHALLATLSGQLTADGRGRAATAQHLALSQALVNQLHALCTAVRPPALDELGLAGAIEVLALDLTERAGADAGVSIRLDIDAEFAGAPLPPGADVVLYRTAQEALNNSLCHARPRAIDLSLRRHAGTVQLRVADGMGFAAPARVDDLAQTGHLGLVGLQHRVQRAGGRLWVMSTPGQGAVVQVELPVEGGA